MSSHRRRSATPAPEAAPGTPVGVDIPIATGTARIEDEEGGLMLYVNGAPSSHHDPDPEVLFFEYLRWARIIIEHVAVPRGGRAVQIAHLGAAGCSLARALAAGPLPVHQVAIELDPVLAAGVRSWFDLPSSPVLRIRTGDAIAAVPGFPDERFDVVVRDVFATDRVPHEATTADFAREVHRVVGSGLYVANCADHPPLREAADEIVTLRAEFPTVAVVADPGVVRGRRYGNLLLVATESELPADLDRLIRADPAAPRLLRGAELDRLAATGAVRAT